MTQYQTVPRAVSCAIAVALLLSAAAAAVQSVHACTGIRLTAEDGTVVHARTLEFAIDIHTELPF